MDDKDINIINIYAPNMSKPKEKKDAFYQKLIKILESIFPKIK